MNKTEERIVDLLKDKGELTTSQIEDYFRKEGVDCPDGAAKNLMRLKGQGLIQGRIDREKRGWVWSVA